MRGASLVAPVVLLALTVWLPEASAQTTPAATLTLEGFPPAALNTTREFYQKEFTATLALRNLVCPNPAVFEVALEATHGANLTANESVGFAFAPPVARFAVSAGEYLTGPYEDESEETLTVTLGSIPPTGLVLPVTVAATLPAGNQGCQGQGQLASQSATGTFQVVFESGARPPPAPTDAMPGPSLTLVLVGLALAAWVRPARRP